MLCECLNSCSYATDDFRLAVICAEDFVNNYNNEAHVWGQLV